MASFVPSEKAVPIRQPSTANLMIDSVDGGGSPWDFQISKKQALLNGFFTRVATTEVVLEWSSPNIDAVLGNNQLQLDLSGTGSNTYAGPALATLFSGFYTMKELIDALVASWNAQVATTGTTFSVSTSGGRTVIDISGAEATVSAGNQPLAIQLTPTLLVPTVISFSNPDLSPYRYIDFVSEQLTYCQDLKDASTSEIERNVLCRWYFADDVPEQLDAYGFPIFMGYKAFRRRRLFNPAKQIKWESNLPIGNLAFQVYDQDGVLVKASFSSWLMTLQVSEV